MNSRLSVKYAFGIITLSLMVSIALLAIPALKENNKTIDKVEDYNTNEFKEFIVVMTPHDTSFREHYDINTVNINKIIESLRNDDVLDSAFRLDALQNIKRTYRKLNEYENALKNFKNSSNIEISKLIRECLLFCEYARKVVQEHEKFISSPLPYLSDDNLDRLTNSLALFKEQDQFIIELVQLHIEIDNKIKIPTNSPVEFKYSQDELDSMDQWKNKSFDDLTRDALNGDPAAMYMIGLCFLYGKELPISIEHANDYFAAAASLGYAPALDKIRAKYIEDEANPFLSMVYVNLVTCHGHSEYSMAYHSQRSILVEKFGVGIANEIERLAVEKMENILTLKNQFESEDNKTSITLELYLSNGIVGDDINYGLDYWEKFNLKDID